MNVTMLRWPAEAAKVEQCRSLGVPRLLVLDQGIRPPLCADPLEDWIRVPATSDDLHARSQTLLARARCNVPVLDASRVLHFGGSCKPLAASEADIVRVLVQSFQTVVDREELIREAWPAGNGPQRNALDLRILRIRRRIEPLGLVIRTAWGRGYLMASDREVV